MAELLILFTPDKSGAASEVARAAADEGYDASLAPIEAPDALAERVRAVPAALLIWSRSLSAWAMDEARLGALRQLPNLIEVSTDGIAPDTGEAGRVVLLSGWRGQPHHLGWQRILDQLSRLAAPRPTRPPRRPEADPPAGRGPDGPRTARRLVLPALGLAALAAAAGAIAWGGSGSPGPAGQASSATVQTQGPAPIDTAALAAPAQLPRSSQGIEPLAMPATAARPAPHLPRRSPSEQAPAGPPPARSSIIHGAIQR